MSLLYIKRLRQVQSLSYSKSLLEIDQLTTRELYLIATLLADKYLIDEGEDDQLFNSDLTEITGIRSERINLIERQLLIALNWNLFVPNSEIASLVEILKRAAQRKTEKHTTTDGNEQILNILMKYFPKIFECLAITSLVLLGSSISILTAIHVSTLTQSTVMKCLNPNRMNITHGKLEQREKRTNIRALFL